MDLKFTKPKIQSKSLNRVRSPFRPFTYHDTTYKVNTKNETTRPQRRCKIKNSENPEKPTTPGEIKWQKSQ
jgi:hypothetical protein